jgi:hypothetical protein
MASARSFSPNISVRVFKATQTLFSKESDILSFFLDGGRSTQVGSGKEVGAVGIHIHFFLKK